MDVTITIDDAAVRNMLNRAPDRINWAMRAAMNDATSLLLRDMRIYPTQNPDSTYTRTHNLQGSWTKEITGTSINVQGRVGSNSNEAPYNRYVQDATMQNRNLTDRWGTHTVQYVRDQRAATVQGFFETRLREAVSGL